MAKGYIVLFIIFDGYKIYIYVSLLFCHTSKDKLSLKKQLKQNKHNSINVLMPKENIFSLQC